MADNNYKSAQKHREWVTLALTKIKSDIEHIKEKVNANETHLSNKMIESVRRRTRSLKFKALVGLFLLCSPLCLVIFLIKIKAF